MGEIKYSIIIPHYNIPELLLRCISSIPERDDIQVIVVDDNSPDAENRMKEYPGIFRRNVNVYFTKEGRGAGYARNEGLKHAEGKWVLFADSDDFFVDNFLEIIEEYYTSNADIVYFNIRSVMSDDITQPAHRNDAKTELFNEYHLTKNSSPFRYDYPEPWSKLIKLNLIKENNIKFDETKVSNDYYFSVVSGCLAHNILVDNRPLYIVTLRENSLSYNYGDTLQNLLTRLEVTAKVQIFAKAHGFNIKPMPVRGLMVLLFKKSPATFIKQIFSLSKKGIYIPKLLYQIFCPTYMRRH